MTRILHLSDLHFGLHRPELVDPLVQAVNDCAAELIVVTGDLTHRARPSQFRQARAFLDRLDAPWLALPGNHDLPVGVFRRLLRPLGHYRHGISPDPEPDQRVGRIRVLAINSADPFSWERGRIRPGKISAILASISDDDLNIIAVHHPFQQRPEVNRTPMRGAPEALARLEKSGAAHIILSGHLHRWSAGAFLRDGARYVLEVQAGTALCARPGDRQNEFAILTFEGPELHIRRHIAPMPELEFQAMPTQRFSRAGGIWHDITGATPDTAD